jgi:hypothetical protein
MDDIIFFSKSHNFLKHKTSITKRESPFIFHISSFSPLSLYHLLTMASIMKSSHNSGSHNINPKSCASYYGSYYYSYAWLVAWYIFFGALHEAAHFMAAAVCLFLQQHHHGGGKQNNHNYSSLLSSILPSITPNSDSNDDSNNWILFLLRIALSRQISLDLEECEEDDSSSTASCSSRDDGIVFWVRHAGWVTSAWLAVGAAACFVHHVNRQSRTSGGGASSNCHHEHTIHHHTIRLVLVAAVLTAVEAIATDLLGIPTIPLFLFPTNSSSVHTTTFFCGNFGIILLHQAWLQSNGESALDVLEKMILVSKCHCH